MSEAATLQIVNRFSQVAECIHHLDKNKGNEEEDREGGAEKGGRKSEEGRNRKQTREKRPECPESWNLSPKSQTLSAKC